jgi:prepilin-type processing-associated H-X9-DG protein
MRRQTGLTLAQLVIVIAIIGILAAILVPVIARARDSALRASCASNLSQIGKALHMYASDWDGYAPCYTTGAAFPPGHAGGGQDAGSQTGAMSATTKELKAAYEPYLKNDKVWFCPASAGAHKQGKHYDFRLTTYGFDHNPRSHAPVLADKPRADEIAGWGPAWLPPQVVAYAWDEAALGLPDLHPGGRNAVFYDAHVKFCREASLDWLGGHHRKELERMARKYDTR